MKNYKFIKTYKRGALTTLAAMLLTVGSGASAQETVELEEIVVKGIRGSLKQSLDVKRNSDQIVDAISSEDVGKFPDANIADSLQRITGVSIDRSGGEGQFITVRGLGPEFNTVLVNGRTMATDNEGREFSFDVLSSNVISRAEIYKSSTANLQEGGIGATVNIVTARPLDLDGTNFDFSAAAIYDTLDSSSSPDLSATYSHTNDDETWGVVAAISHSDRSSQRDFVDINGFRDVNLTTIPNGTGLTNDDLTGVSGLQVPRNVRFGRGENDRERTVANLTFQARPSDAVEVSIDALYSDFTIDSVLNIHTPFFTDPFIGVESDANGTVTGFNRPGQNFLSSNPDLTIGLSQNDNVATAENRDAEVYQIGTNVQWEITDNFSVLADLSTSKATRDEFRPFVVIGTLATTSPRFDLNPQNDIPSVTNQGVINDSTQLRNHFSQARDIATEDEITEARLEGNWAVDNGALRELSFGTLFSEREKTQVGFQTPASSRCLYCGYNLTNTAPVEAFSFGSFLGDASGNEGVPQSFFIFDPVAVLENLSQEANLRNPQRQPGQTIAQINAAADIALAQPNGPFGTILDPAQGFNVEEQVASVFLNSAWGGAWGETPWSANLGLRITTTDTTSRGFGQELVNLTRPAGDDRIDPTFTPPQPIVRENDYTNYLPSANVKFELSDTQNLRFAFSQTVTRPTLTSLGTNTNFTDIRVSGGTSTGGNPDLEPFESNNFDISYENYYADASFFGAALFYKDFENFLESQTRPTQFQFFNQVSGQDETVTIQDTRTQNGEEGSITGAELAVQHSFEGGALDGFGVIANYTYVSSDVSRANDSSSTECDYNGLSENSFNIGGFYEKNDISARLSYNWRDEYLVECFGQQSRPQSREAFGQLDFSASYNIRDSYQVFLQGVNILDEDSQEFSVFEDRFILYEDTGSRYTVGVRGQF